VAHINACADYVIMISRNLKALEEALQELDNTAQDTGLIINQEKTVYIKISKKITLSI
jgi:hypothetical protein